MNKKLKAVKLSQLKYIHQILRTMNSSEGQNNIQGILITVTQ